MSSLEENRKPKEYMSANRDTTNHIHTFVTMASIADRHQHTLIGTTGPAIYSGNSHTHRICIRTTFDPKHRNAHWHLVEDTTGPAIDVPCEEHTHHFNGETSHDLGHHHCYNSVTDTSPDNDCEEE